MYTENIAAAYGTYSSRINKVGYSLGLRGEYTSVKPWVNKSEETVDQHYFELFPTAFVMLPFGKTGQHSLVLNYNRTISRPSFSLLSPFRFPGSEYLFIEGNPKLKPALQNNYTASFRLFNRYNMSIGVTDAKGTFEPVFQTDPDAPGIIVRRTENVGHHRNYYISANATLNPVKWWQIMLNVSGTQSEITIFDDKNSILSFFCYMSNTFTLPNNFMLDLNGFYRSPTIDGNLKYTMDPQVNTALRKDFFNKRLSMRLYVDNLFNMGKARVETNEKDFNKDLHSQYGFRQFGLSFRYNFSAGKSVQVKNVQTGAAEERARLQ
jgi:outer membrane receptor protein involved in Fe transport